MKRYRGTARRNGIENKKPRWILKVTDTETNEVVQVAIVKSKDIDGAVVMAKTMAKEWEKTHD